MQRLANGLKGLAALVLVAFLLGGVPYVLTRFGAPWPDSVPSSGSIGDFLTGSSVSDSLLVKILLCVAWILWVQVALGVVVETIALVRGRTASRIPLGGLTQPFARKLVGMAALIITVVIPSTLSGVAPALADSPFGTAPTELTSTASGGPTMTVFVNAPSADTGPSMTVRDIGSPTVAAQSGAQKVYQVERRDTLWDIAEKHLGDGMRWKEIFQLNEGTAQPDGSVLKDANLIRPGWKLVLPGDAVGIEATSVAATPAAPAQPEAPTAVEGKTIVRDDFSRLAPPVTGIGGGGSTNKSTPSTTVPSPSTTIDRGAPDVSIPGSEIDRDNIIAPDAPSVPTTTPPTTTPPTTTPPTTTTTTPPTTTTTTPTQTTNPNTPAPIPTQENAPVVIGTPAPPVANLTPQAPSVDKNETADVGVAGVEVAPVSFDVDNGGGPAMTGGSQQSSVDIGDAVTIERIGEGTSSVFDTSGGYVVATPYYAPQTAASNNVSDDAAQPSALRVSANAVLGSSVTPAFPNAAEGAEPGTSLVSADTLLPVGVLGSMILATGSIGVLARRRRAQARRRTVGNIVPIPDASTASAETALNMTADFAGTSWLNLALRALGVALQSRANAGVAAPTPQAIQLTANSLEVLLSTGGNVDAPAPWRVTSGGWAWSLPADVDVAQLQAIASGANATIPALVTLGRSDNGTVFVDLEAFGVTSVSGDAAMAAGFAHSVAFELANTPLADHVDLLMIGMDLPGVSTLPNVHVVDAFASALPVLTDHVSAIAATIKQSGANNTFSARAGRGTDPLAPIVVLVPAAALTEADTDQLLQLAGSGRRGLAVLIIGASAKAPWTISVRDEMAEVQQLGVRVRVQQLRPSEVGDLGELLLQSLDDDVPNPQSPFVGVAEEAATSIVAPQPGLRDGETIKPLGTLTSSFVEARFDISVNVLGSVDVLGGKAPLDRRQAELVAFLALHPHGVTDEQIKTALWPDKLPALSTFNNLVSTARTKLGATDAGDLYVPLAYDGRYLVSPLVGTDLGRFRARVAYARAATGDDQLATLRDAMRLVRGQVFSGVSRGFEWVSTRGLLVSIEAEIVDASHLLAQLCIARGDLAGAHESINLGLLVSPLNEVLVRDRMLAFDHAGNPTGVEATMRDLCEAIDVEGPISNDDVHPETYALYERLTRRRRGATATAAAN